MIPLEGQLRIVPIASAQQEAALGAVAVRSRADGDDGAMPLAAFIQRLQSELNPLSVSPLGS